MITQAGYSLVASNLRRLRCERGVTQNKLAKLAGFARTTIARLEIGSHGNLSVATLFAICDALGVDITEIFRPLGECPEEYLVEVDRVQIEKRREATRKQNREVRQAILRMRAEAAANQ